MRFARADARAEAEVKQWVADHAHHGLSMVHRAGMFVGLDCQCGAVWLPWGWL